MMNEAQAYARADAARRMQKSQGQSIETADGSGAGTPRSLIQDVTKGTTPQSRVQHKKQLEADVLVETVKITPTAFSKTRVQQLFVSPDGVPSPSKGGIKTTAVSREVGVLEQNIEKLKVQSSPVSPNDAIIGGPDGGKPKRAQKPMSPSDATPARTPATRRSNRNRKSKNNCG